MFVGRMCRLDECTNESSDTIDMIDMAEIDRLMVEYILLHDGFW